MKLMKGGVSASLAISTSPLVLPTAGLGGAQHSSSARAEPPVEMTWVGVAPPAAVKTFTVLQFPPQTGVGPSPTKSCTGVLGGSIKVIIPLGPARLLFPPAAPANALGPVGTS
jgi:hypothetical protein